MITRRSLTAALAIACILFPSTAMAVEPETWSDSRLPATGRMLLWLDASAQHAAAKANNVEPTRDGAPLEIWYDSSGHGRHVRQPVEKSRPILRLKNNLGSIRFDGRAAHFLFRDVGPPEKELTIFVVAAPAGNEGTFRALFSVLAKGQDDFRSGLNIDLGPFRTASFDTVNVEGAGFPGVQNLRSVSAPFLNFHRLCIQSAVGDLGVTLHVDGQAEGKRDRVEGNMAMEELLIGARSYGGAGISRGYFAGEIAEVIVYSRVLKPQEREDIDAYLEAKYREAGPIPPLPNALQPGTIPRVDTPPVVQMVVPGFTVRELPLELTNINNVLYRDDGTLIALAYDGNIHLLTDSNGDGLEDKSELFWKNEGQLSAPIGMALTPPKYSHGQGVIVAAKGKCLLIVDTDGDDRADKEIIVADGWTALPHGVDALGAAFDPKDHAIFFGLGTTSFIDPYLINLREKAAYHLQDERGAILRIAPDLKSREIFATGIRFPVAIRFNPAGDLFCTDQEGATWLSNGNPFDELLHIERGRHYGFPPRHPRHLPNVIDEPSVHDYRPQHQSVCGLNFNEPAADGTIFGPDWWRSDAIVTGYSRGKLYRTKLVRTPGGYVAQNQLIASLAMMPADACIAPGGSLVIAAHSGAPDWGSGPGGLGKLFKVTRDPADMPTPALVWASSPQEVKIAFDRPVDPETLRGVASRTQIEGGEFVAPADRLEFLRPGYVAVDHQQNAPRFGVEVQGLQLSADRRTLILSTAPHAAAVGYAIALRGQDSSQNLATAEHEVPQLPDIDLQYDLSGVEATWNPEAGDALTSWLPHLDLDVSRAFTQPSAEHESFWRQVKSAGTLVLRTSLDLKAMLRPVVQIGSTIDYEWPEEQITITLRSNRNFDIVLGGKQLSATSTDDGNWTLQQKVPNSAQPTLPLEVRLHHQQQRSNPTLTISYHTQEDSRPRALAAHRFILPWAKPTTEPSPMVDNSELPELKGGNWLRGQDEFHGPVAGCGKCHAVRGKGSKIGPDLSNLSKRDYASVVRDITHPSFAINPDYITQSVVTTNGQVFVGAVRTDGDNLIVSNDQGEEKIIARSDVEELEPTQLSIMPEGAPKAVGPERMRDLLMFLLVEPPNMPVYGELQPPLPRTPSEVEAVLDGAKPIETKSPVHVALISGRKDHGLGEHDYPAWQKAWRRLLEMDESVHVTTADPWPSAEDLKSADVLVFYQQGAWTPERARDIDAFLSRGGGLVYVHYAVDGGTDPTGFAERIGLAWQGGRSKFRHGPLDVEFASSEHPIARNLDRVHFHDESYWQLAGPAKRVNILATGIEEGQPQPLFWTHEPKIGGRVFVSIPGHYSWTFDDPIFRILLLRGIAWSAGEPVDRFNKLVFPGARIAQDKP